MAMTTTTLHVQIAQNTLALLHGSDRTDASERALYRASCELLRNIVTGELSIQMFGQSAADTPNPGGTPAAAEVPS